MELHPGFCLPQNKRYDILSFTSGRLLCMKRVFFIDSENVGDNWTLMLDNVEAEDELLVFYTQKSPHMSYRNLIHLKESSKDVTFIECFEGSNALDFQLVSELGYRIALDADCRYYIITNDTGFESAVKYWRRRNIYIRRLPGKACASIGMPAVAAENAEDTSVLLPEEAEAQAVKTAEEVLPAGTQAEETVQTEEAPRPKKSGRSSRRSKASKTAPVQEAPAEVQTADSAAVDVLEDDPLIVEEVPQGPDDQSMEVLYCVGKDNLADLHEALVQLYGDRRCQVLYNVFKSDPAYDAFLEGHEELSPYDRQLGYCTIVFACAGSELAVPDDFIEVVTRAWKRKNNLNSLRAALISKYGREYGLQYYSLVKAHIKILNNIS